MKTSLLFLLISFCYLSKAQTVTIGTQVWMTKNLDVSTFRNGDPIPQAKTDEEWVAAGENKQAAWCYAKRHPANGKKYGKLYNWYAVNDPRGIAPFGYHVPSDAEWTKLYDFLGSDAEKKMKSTSGWPSYTVGEERACPNCVSWNAEYRSKVPCHKCKDTRRFFDPNIEKSGNGTNSSGFSGLPGGYCYINQYHQQFIGPGSDGLWWSSTELSRSIAGSRSISVYGFGTIACCLYEGYKTSGLSVRCLRD